MKVSGQKRLRYAQIRIGVHCVQRARHRDAGARPHLGRFGGRAARSRGVRRNLDERRARTSSVSSGRAVLSTRPYSAIRLTHIPNGIAAVPGSEVATKNLDKAFEELRTRVFNLEYSKYLDQIASKRKTMVSTGDRSAKIRTCQLSSGAHHRPPHQLYDLQPRGPSWTATSRDCIDHLIVAENAERLKESFLEL